MVEQQLRAMGLKVGGRGPGRPRIHPLPDEDVRCPTGRAPAARPGWEAFLISVKRTCDSTWPSHDKPKITTARRRTDAGTHTMTQTTSREGWIHLYCIPLKQPIDATTYFSSLEAQA